LTAVSILKPPGVRRGAKIAVLSLASSFRPELLPVGLDALSSLGFVPCVSKHASARTRPYFAGTPEERLRDLHAAFADPEIAAIVCTRGGYGSNYLLQGLDLELIARHPKPLFAYSDMTNLQDWLLDRTGLAAFHGPMLTADFAVSDGVDTPSFLAALSGLTYEVGHAEGLRILQSGTAQGTLYGGCLSILVASLGTPYAVQTEGRVLFIEDVGAKPYQIDRMLRQMLLAGKFDGVGGIVFGEMLDCVSPGADPLLLEEVILSVMKDFKGPIGIGLRSGHVSRGNVTLAFGVRVELDLTQDPMLRFVECATQEG
jgi:muramoyltetrapeptide carboxypeptidase